LEPSKTDTKGIINPAENYDVSPKLKKNQKMKNPEVLTETQIYLCSHKRRPHSFGATVPLKGQFNEIFYFLLLTTCPGPNKHA
jgi:hypothetical protein